MLIEEMAGASLIIVDFDGTLVCLETDWQALRKELETFCRYELHTKESFESLDMGLLRINDIFGKRIFEQLLEKVSFYEMQGYRGKNIDKVLHPLRTLQKEKKIAVFSSNCRKTITSILPELGLHVRYIVAKEDIDKPKPSGNGIKKILQYFHIMPEEAIFIGDSNLDFLAGREAGVKTLLWMNVYA